MPNPWDNDPIVGPAPQGVGIGRPVIRKGPDPSKPEFIPGSPGQIFDPSSGVAKDIPGFKPKPPGDKTTYHTLTPKEAAAQGLPPGVYQQGSDGKVEKVGDIPKIDTDLANSIKGLGIDELLTNINRARSQIKTGFATGVLGSLAGHFPGTPRQDFLGSLEGIKGASILEKLQALRDQSKNGSSGMGSLTEQEGERLANSIASLSPGMSAKELNNSLDIMERHARSLQAIGAGADPNDPTVQQAYHIPPLPGAGAAPEGGAPPQNPLANGGEGGDLGPSLTPSGGQTRTIVDPQKQALGQKIVGLMSKGADRNTIMGFAVRADPTLRNDPKFRAWVDEGLKYRKTYPNAKFPIDPGFYTSEVPLSAQEKVGNAVAQSAPGAALMNAGDAVTAGNMGKLTGDEEGVDRALAVANAQHPIASLGGTMAGGATAMLGAEGLLARAGLTPGLLSSGVADAAYGGAVGASSPNGNMLGNIGTGAALGALGGFAGNKIASGLGAAVKGVTNPTVGYVAKDVPLTIGQAVSQSGLPGKIVKGLEDRVAGIPVVGDAINARRLEGLQKMNAKAFDRALEPIGGRSDGAFGEQAVAAAQDQVSSAFNRALAGRSAALDHGFIVDATKAKMGVEKLPDRVREEVNNSIDEAVNNYFDDGGNISGENMQALLRELGQIKRAYSGDPLGHRIGKVVDSFTDSVEGLFRRQAPDVMPQYNAAKQAFRRVSILEDAVNKAKNETDGESQVFTTGQLGLVDRANSIKYDGKGAAAAGESPFHEFHQKMHAVLPNKVPDSGTVGRALVMPGMLIASGGAGGALEGRTGEGLTLGTLLALAYSKYGRGILTASVLKRPNAARTAGQALVRAAPAIGHGTAAQTALGQSRE
jgi:hypothetical protein